MCISDLNPQIQFQNLNLSSKIISPMRKTEPVRETSTDILTPHLAATRPQKQAAKNYLQTEYWIVHSTLTTTALSTTYSPTYTPVTPLSSTTSAAIRSWPTPLMEMTTIQELGVTRTSFKEYHNQSIYR